MRSGYRIDEVARRTGLTPRTLRFWEEKGLLLPPARTEGGMRLYTDADIARIERIRDLKAVLGLSLDVIRDLLAAEDELARLRQQACQQRLPAERLPLLRQAVAILEAQVAAMAERAARLEALRREWEDRLAALRRRLAEVEAQAQMGEAGAAPPQATGEGGAGE